jgi:hypothetical protein
MADKHMTQRPEDDDQQPKPIPVRGKFHEIYNPVTRQSYVYRDGEWIPKPDPRMNPGSVSGQEIVPPDTKG